jgi:hypothetical protein
MAVKWCCSAMEYLFKRFKIHISWRIAISPGPRSCKTPIIRNILHILKSVQLHSPSPTLLGLFVVYMTLLSVMQTICIKPFFYASLVYCKYIPLLNLHRLIFGLTSFSRLCSIMLTPNYSITCYKNNIFIFPFWFMPTFSETQLGHETRAWCFSGND